MGLWLAAWGVEGGVEGRALAVEAEAEAGAMQAIARALNGSLPWDPSSVPCDPGPPGNSSARAGVTCSGGLVVGLELANYGLGVPLAVFLPLCRLSSLQRLDLSYNGLTGPLLSEWANMTALAYLDLGCGPSAQGCTGAMPNRLSGGLPGEWALLGNLTHLDLSGNGLSGPLPPAWAALALLSYLSLWGNRLSGACGADPLASISSAPHSSAPPLRLAVRLLRAVVSAGVV